MYFTMKGASHNKAAKSQPPKVQQRHDVNKQS